MSQPRTNLQILKPSREQRLPGDIFTYLMPDGAYRYGRLIARGTTIGGFEPADAAQHLVYFYNPTSANFSDVPLLERNDMLIPPVAINQKPWTLGYFMRVARIPLTKNDILLQHCFHSVHSGRLFDEMGNALQTRSEPCGTWGLHSYRSVDDDLSAALGIEPAPDA